MACLGIVLLSKVNYEKGLPTGDWKSDRVLISLVLSVSVGWHSLMCHVDNIAPITKLQAPCNVCHRSTL